ncbi:MAG: PQQ-binding-like beta-propeller repeat protein [Planctomycetota bacterium]|nr:PQQ-binding-like beta-propeller repeat protein [Planctomycetota bacterium]
MRSPLFAVLLAPCLAWLGTGRAAAGEDAAALLEKTGVRGGLCLVIGARDTALATALAAKSALYVQVLQPDAKLAPQWGLEVTGSAQRESLGVREAAFDPEHYGSDLFNLIVVEDAAALGKAALADLCRMLVPDGSVALRNPPASFAVEAKALAMDAQAAGGFPAVFRKPTKPVEWRICDSVKWRAGPRAQLSSGWGSVGTGDGKLFYRERMEIPGTLDASSSQLFARDGYNGRALWSVEESKWLNGAPRPLAAVKGRVFTPLGEKLVCLDSNTGKPLFDLIPSGLGGRWSLTRLEAAEDLLLASGEIGFRAYSLSDGKEVWRLGGVDRWLYGQSKLITVTRQQIQARSLKDHNKVLWTVKEENPHGLFCSEKYLHVVRNKFPWAAPSVATHNMDTGETVWSYSAPLVKGRNYSYEFFGDRFYVLAYSPYENKAQDLWVTRLNIHTGKVEAEDCGPKGAEPCNMCAPIFHKAGKYLVYFFSVWVDLENNQRTFPYLAHPSCGIGTVFCDGMMYNIPSRKAGALQGISAMAPADITFDHEPGGKVLRKFAEARIRPDTKEDEWPMFRANPERGNAVKADPGEKPAKVWEATLGLGGKSFGVMSGQRTGLTQPVVASGLVVVADIDGQRIVALDAADGKQRWVFHVGSRVDFPPSLHKGLCFFAARDGWGYCLNAPDGSLAWKLLIAPRERLVGGQDKLESLWPTVSDVLVANGVAYASAGLSFDHLGGARAVAFRPETGEVVWSQTYFDEKHTGYGAGPCANMLVAGTVGKGAALAMGDVLLDPASGKVLQRGKSIPGTLRGGNMDDYLAGGVSIPRNGEDRAPVGLEDGRIWGKTIAFDRDLSVAYAAGGGPETWEYKGKVNLYAKKAPGKTNLWEKPDSEMTVDDIVLTPQFAYCVGHYQRVKKDPELLVVAREDGKVLNAVGVDGFPAFNGMSAAGKRLYISTREGKLICYQRNE